MEFHLRGEALWDRMNRAVEKVQERLERTVTTLEAATIPYAIIGGNAVRAWVAQADEAAVRTTRDVDVLLRKEDLPRAIVAMEAQGFVYRRSAGIDMFLDSADASARDSVHVLLANQKVLPSHCSAAPDVDESVPVAGHCVISLEALVRMKLTSFRRKDQMHLIDMIDVDLVDQSWVSKYEPGLATRLQELFDNPE